MKRTNYATRCEGCGQIRCGNEWLSERREKVPSYLPGLCPACRMRRSMALRRAAPVRRHRQPSLR